ncbi:MAG: DUF3806 domain-containing protein [Proteobacteria bacterium]|nr:DUF3806 domain-containing protein [Pseudomonadota bacterium]
MFSELLPDDVEQMERQRKLVRVEARARYGAALHGEPRDMQILERMLSDHVYAPEQRYELQSMGVCFGDALASSGQFHWVIIDDEYGRDPTLRWKETSLNVNALTVIAKRVERGEAG